MVAQYTLRPIRARVLVGSLRRCAYQKLVRAIGELHELRKALADPFALCDDTFSDLTDADAMEFVKYGEVRIARGALLAYMLVHSSEMYGISTVYLRAMGVVPPSTERKMRTRDKARSGDQ